MSIVLAEIARRSGMEAVARAYNAGLSVPAIVDRFSFHPPLDREGNSPGKGA